MIAINNPEINVDEIMKKIREEVAKRKRREKRPFESSKTHIPETWSTYEQTKIPNLNLHELSIHPPFKKGDNGAYHVNDLLKYHHKEFVKNAYLAILGRNPDSSGLDNYLRLLNRGEASKMEILGRLRYSSEGRKINVRIRGLTVPFVGHLLFRIPVLGYLARLGTAVLKMPRVLRNIRQFENYTVSMHEAFLNHINQNSSDIERNFNQLAETLKSEMQGYEELHNSLASINQGLAERDEQITGLETSLKQGLSERDERIEGLDESVIKKGIEHAKQIDALEALINQGLAKQAERISGFEESVNESLSERDKQIVALETSVDQKVHDQDNLISALESNMNQGLAYRDKLVAGLEESFSEKFGKWNNRIAALDKKISSLNSNIVWQERSLSTFLEREKKLKTQGEEDLRLSEPFYVSFEDRFRGTREDIKDRLRIYLPIVQDATAGTGERPALDVGCGRGEWIELLIEQGLVVHGLELNHVLVKQCCERGMDVVQGDVIEYLQTLPDNSLGAVTGFHIIEHLPFITLIKLFDETIRVLKPGGLVIFETPNPESILVGACNFYLDPTHCAPLPAPMIKFMAESRGLCRVEIKPLHPFDDEFKIKNDDSDLAKRFNAYFYGPRDYAAIGYKS